MIEFSKWFNLKNFTIQIIHILQFKKLSNILGVQIISKKWKNGLKNKNIE